MSINDFIQKLRARPVQDRERLSYGVATGFTALVALVWVTTSFNNFLVPAQSAAMAIQQGQAAVASAVTQGGAAATTGLPSTAQDTTPHLQIVEVSHSSTLATSTMSEKTVIPF